MLEGRVHSRFPEAKLFIKDEDWFIIRFSFLKENISLGNWKRSALEAWASAEKCLTGQEKVE